MSVVSEKSSHSRHSRPGYSRQNRQPPLLYNFNADESNKALLPNVRGPYATSSTMEVISF